MLKNAMVILELGGSESNQQYLEFRGDDFDADIHVEIFHEGVVRTITSESWGVFDSHSTDAPLSISLCTVMVTLYLSGTRPSHAYHSVFK
jgi:hypothetical protein